MTLLPRYTHIHSPKVLVLYFTPHSLYETEMHLFLSCPNRRWPPMGEILSQCILIANHHVVHFQYLTILFVNYISLKLGEKNLSRYVWYIEVVMVVRL